MKLLNITSRYFAVALLIIIPLWAAVFYYAMLDEIYDSIDDGLDNQKGLIIQKAASDTQLLNKPSFDEGDYVVREIPPEMVKNMYDHYADTMMYMQNEKSEEPVRMLKTVFKHDNRYFQLQVVTSMVEEDDLVRQLLYSLLWLYGGLVISLVILNNILLKKIWKPFHHIVGQLKKYRLDKPEKVSSVPTRVDEFNQLNDTIQKLIERNMNIYNSQKQFIENASHELQTPLAIGIAKLETLAEDPRLSEDQLKLLSAALDTLDRLTRLNKSLLLLSKIDNQQFADERVVNINEIAKNVLSDFKDQSDYYTLQVTITEEGHCMQQMNPDLALVMLTNLVKNAIIHNNTGGFVRLIISNNSLSVENSGVNMPLDGQKIFDRFHAGQLSSSTGLGLAIVKAVAQTYRCDVTYFFNGSHHITVKFPDGE